ncbi:MAG: glucose-1-phosphate adenylyltransferase [Abitibacteriaceae bacterium]|nr:glucose-1-phosphate adenylyltransferase [Abditibacteriaceae bacterium]
MRKATKVASSRRSTKRSTNGQTASETTPTEAAVKNASSTLSNGTEPPASPVDRYARPNAVHYAPTISRGVFARGQESELQQTMVMVLAGGQGERLYPLTKDRAKPAVPFGAHYRIIDFALSNCINSGMRRILVLTQYKSFSLQRHIQATWSLFNAVLGEYIDVIPPQQRNVKRWYQGTADAIFQNIYMLEQERPRFVVILGGDHIYKMDYAKMLDFHLRHDADLTISCTTVSREEAKRLGVAGTDETGRITRFVEKPKDPPTIPGSPNESYASMGVYIFSTDILVRRVIEDVKQDTEHDFGKNIIPRMVRDKDRVFAYPFVDENKTDNHHNGEVYWRDIGTMASYYDVNMDLVSGSPAFNLYDDEWPIHRRSQPGPPAKTLCHGTDRLAIVHDSLLATGAIVSGSSVVRSILGPRCFIHSWADVEDSILFDDVEVGRHCRIRRAIIDKHVKIPAGTVIGHDLEADRQRFTVTPEGVVVIPKGMVLK